MRKIINKNNNENKKIDSQKIYESSISLKRDEWEKLKNISLNKSKNDLNQNFIFFLSFKLQEIGLNCWLKCRYNRFSKRHSFNSKNPYWKGYFCCNKECGLDLTSSIQKNNNSDKEILIGLRWFGMTYHEKAEPLVRCSGILRELIGNRIFEISLPNTKAENILFNSSKKTGLFSNILFPYYGF